MTILYVTDAFAVWGGMERVLADKMNYLLEQYGYDVCLLTINQGLHSIPFSLNPMIKHLNLNVRMHDQYEYSALRRVVKLCQLKSLLYKRLREALHEIDPDIIICAKLDFVGGLNKVRGNVPLVVESHTLCIADKFENSGWLRRLHVRRFKSNVRKTDVVVALTEGDAKDWLNYHQNAVVIPNVVHLDDSEFKSNSSEKRIIFVGRYDKQKDFESLLRIWKLVYSCYPDWTLDIFSDGYVEVPGVRVFKPISNIMDQYLNSSLLVLTSLYEPFGLVLPEAMSCGLPVVAFDCPYGPSEILTDGVDGFLVKNRDINEFADRVCQLIQDKELRVRMGQAGIKSSQRYRADLIMPKWKDLFERLCQKE